MEVYVLTSPRFHLTIIDMSASSQDDSVYSIEISVREGFPQLEWEVVDTSSESEDSPKGKSRPHIRIRSDMYVSFFEML